MELLNSRGYFHQTLCILQCKAQTAPKKWVPQTQKLYAIKLLCEGFERSFVLRKGAVVPVKLHFPGSANIVNGNVANVGTVIFAGMLTRFR